MKKTFNLLLPLFLALGIISYALGETKPYTVDSTGCTGFVNKQDLEKFLELYQQRDEQARIAFVVQKLISKEAYRFESGETVYVSGKWEGYSRPSRIRKAGEIKEYYVFSSCVAPK